MNLTPEQMAIGRRNFLKAIAGVPAVAALGTAAAIRGPARGGAVRVGFVGVGGQGRALLGRLDPVFADVRAMADINPVSLQRADDVLARGLKRGCEPEQNCGQERQRSRDPEDTQVQPGVQIGDRHATWKLERS